MFFNKAIPVLYLQVSILLTATTSSPPSNATIMGDEHYDSTTSAVTAYISLDPPFPQRGNPFTVRVSGKWRNSCFGGDSQLEIDTISTRRITVTAPFEPTQGCQEDKPTSFVRSVVLPGSVWETIDVQYPIEVQFVLDRGIYTPEWHREIDLMWGLHEIPPQIGAGLWVSDALPYKGLFVEQQADTVVLYELNYSSTTGEPYWFMANARFYGDATHGVAKIVHWLAPPDLDSLGSGIPNWDGIQAEREDLYFEKWSFGIDVKGVNDIDVFFGASHRPHGYKRRVFALDDVELPAVIPDMSGRWGLYGFIEQSLEQSYQIEFKDAVKDENGWYRFQSIEDGWELVCQSNWEGVGDCTLLNHDVGLTMHYDLLDFNGNYAKSTLVNSDAAVTVQTGILLRSGLHPPVLDFQ